MMKIWIPSIRTGSGSDVYVERLAQGLTEQGITVVVQWFPHYFELCPYALRFIKPPPATDLIFANSWAAVAFTRHPIPVVTCVHHCVHDPHYRPFKSALQAIYHRLLIYPFEASGLKHSAAVVTGSQFTQQVVSRVFNMTPHWISYAIDTETFKPATPKAKPARPYKLLFIGNPSSRKGFDLLPKIMQQLGGDFKLYLTTGLRNHHLSETIPHAECVGSLSTAQLVQLYQECDALLFPTRYEGFGYAVAEAMACGLPVVASACSSIPELLADGKGGFLCPVDSVDDFVDNIRLLKTSPALGHTMGAYNRQQALLKFSQVRMTKAYLELFKQVLATHAAGKRR